MVCYKRLNDIFRRVDDVAERVLHLVNRSCFTPLEHFEDVEQCWVISVYLVLRVIFDHHVFHPNKMHSH